MQVLCKLSNDENKEDIRCNVCGQGFAVYWSRTGRDEQDAARKMVLEALEQQHATSKTVDAHPKTGFNVPEWSGLPRFSGAALLGGAETWAI